MSTNIIPGTDGGQHISGAPLTTVNAEQAAPGLLRNSIDSRIVRIRPMSTPLDQISRLSVPRHCGSMTVEYYQVDTKPTESTVKADVMCDMATPHGDDSVSISISVVDPSIFDVSDTILFPEVSNDGTPLVGYVAAVNDDKLQVSPVEKLAQGIIIPAKARVIRMARAATELDVQTAQFQALPKKARNNCQIFKMQVEQSTLQKLADKEVGWTFSDQEEAAVIDMRMGMEKNFLFGTCAKVHDFRKNEYVYLTGGIWNQVPDQFELDIDHITHADITEMCARVFSQNGGSRQKVLLGGTDFITALTNLEASHTVNMREPKVKWGLEFHEIVSNFGRIFVIHSETLDQCGFSKDALIIDPNYLTKYTHIPFNAKRLDLRSAGTRNTDATVITEASCLVLRYPKAHLRVIHK